MCASVLLVRVFTVFNKHLAPFVRMCTRRTSTWRFLLRRLISYLPLSLSLPPQGVCAVVAVALDFLLLACLCWMLAGVILVARSLLSPQPKTKFATYLYVIGWGESIKFPPGLPSGVSSKCSPWQPFPSYSVASRWVWLG